MPIDKIQNIDEERWFRLRAWDELNKVMHYEVEYMTIKNEEGKYLGIIFQSDIYTHDFSKWPPEVEFEQRLKIMEFLRSKDKNNKKIFESDYVRVNNAGGIFVGIASFTEKGFPYIFRTRDGSENKKGCYLDETDTEFEVIGNIYETPEFSSEIKT